MVPAWLIEKKRDGGTLSAEGIRFFIEGFTANRIPDYQMAALAMAIYFRGMTDEEVSALTEAMMMSGDILDLSSIPLPKVDKHSTGGIGDKTSLILAPWLACCGVAVPMISGRSLGITGGTLDKLEAIPGYRTNLSASEFANVVARCGCSIIGQTETLAPADRKLYALRDVTGTVPSIPLICASIMSKKLAEGIEALVLDVKCGKGAFMKDIQSARRLGATMASIGRQLGRKVTVVITDMNQPLGRSAGNALEVKESLDAMKGHCPADLMEVTTELAVEMLLLAGRTTDRNEAIRVLNEAMTSGAVFEKFCKMAELQGADSRALEHPSILPHAKVIAQLTATRTGFVKFVDAEAVGKACVLLGAGRKIATDTVDHAAGLTDIVKAGERVEKGAALAVVHGASELKISEAMESLKGAFEIGDEPPAPTRLIIEKF